MAGVCTILFLLMNFADAERFEEDKETKFFMSTIIIFGVVVGFACLGIYQSSVCLIAWIAPIRYFI